MERVEALEAENRALKKKNSELEDKQAKVVKLLTDDWEQLTTQPSSWHASGLHYLEFAGKMHAADGMLAWAVYKI